MSINIPAPASSSSTSGYAVQPDHFYGTSSTHASSTSGSESSSILDPETDPLATRGIPVFKPTMEEFEDFEGYMSKIECWGARSGIVKVIPPEKWTKCLPSVKPQLHNVKIKTPIEQHMLGRGGLFRQENIEKRKVMSVREWVELCSKEEFRAPGVNEVGLHSRGAGKGVSTRPKKSQRKVMAGGRRASKECADSGGDCVLPPPDSERRPETQSRITQSKIARESSQADRHSRDAAFLETFDPHTAWLPPNTTAADYTLDFCRELERQYWRNCGLGKPAWYGADTQGSLYTDDTKTWNVAHLESTLSRLLPASSQGLPGVNTPYLYFGMWRATFAWHVEDMDLFSINYIHFGAPKFWYSIPQGRAHALERTMRSYFPKDTSKCPQFLRHKSFLASPSILGQNSCKPNFLVQHAGEFVITFPRGYHAGFNLGLNCAESVNFALDSWLDLGRKAQVCECVPDSVRIDVDQLLLDRDNEGTEARRFSHSKTNDDITPLRSGKDVSKKRKREEAAEVKIHKKLKIWPTPLEPLSTPSTSSEILSPMRKPIITLKLPKPEKDNHPCCLCVSASKEDLLRVHEPPLSRREVIEATGNPQTWLAHEQCANIIPETWVDEVSLADGSSERVVFGVDAIVKDRWNLKCTACTKVRSKAHGAPIQCTKGKCPKAFHVSCAREGSDLGVVFNIVKEVEKEVVLIDCPSRLVPEGEVLSEQVINQPSIDSDSRVLKVVKKVEVQVLCNQHNPAVAAAKRASKQDKIKNELLALPPMSRIKIRVSAGVFEVSLIRVNEDLGSVEVLWDRGVTREFKWGSVIFGNTEGPIQQKPTDIINNTHTIQDPCSSKTSPLPHQLFPILQASSFQQHAIAPSPSLAVPGKSQPSAPSYLYPGYTYWPYHTPGVHPYTSSHMYTYGSYYVTTPPDGVSYNPYAFYQGPWQWQKSHQASTTQPLPPDSSSTPNPAATSDLSDSSESVVSPINGLHLSQDSPRLEHPSEYLPNLQETQDRPKIEEALRSPPFRDSVFHTAEQVSTTSV
ncbi:hypothetical protein AX16_006153 [Volvariella volvacea WC 439]|nr:hypothetical protein AX16_006153 [Volvariella volvacea WC 439]